MTATHATRVVSLRPRDNHRAEAEQRQADLNAAILFTHAAEHANVRLATCANPICAALRSYMAVAV